jgi:hypothetical protein
MIGSMRAPRIAPTVRAFARPAGSIRATQDLSPNTVRSPDGAKRTPGRLLNESKPLMSAMRCPIVSIFRSVLGSIDVPGA